MLFILFIVLLLRPIGGSTSSVPDFGVTSCSPEKYPNSNAQRQILDIVWSCLAATVSCTWVSVHMNVPFYREGDWTNRRRHLWFMFLSIVTPDIVIMWAFIQMQGARNIKNSVNKLIRQLNDSRGEQPEIKLWTMVHGHFLQMGGFSLSCNLDDNSCRIKTPYQVKRNDTWEGVLLERDFTRLVKEGILEMPMITEEEIKDKSKGDAFSKGVALLQSVWFIVQIVARHFQNMAITELELTTLALVALNSVMYICWWCKPLNVECPIVLTPRRSASNASPTVMASLEEGDEPRMVDCGAMAEIARDLWSAFTSFIASTLKVTAAVLHCIKYTITFVSSSISSRIAERNSQDKLSWIIWDCLVLFWSFLALPITITSLLVLAPLEAIFDPHPIPPNEPPVKDFDSYDILRKIRAIPFKWDGVRNFFYEVYRVYSVMMYSKQSKSATRLLVGFPGVVGVVFGSMHIFAWNYDFPSHFERILWRTSSLTVIASSSTIFIGSSIVTFDNVTYDRRFSHTSDFLVKCGTLIIPVIYVLSRLSLIVQAIVSLRNLPCSAFDTIQWTDFIPHI